MSNVVGTIAWHELTVHEASRLRDVCELVAEASCALYQKTAVG